MDEHGGKKSILRKIGDAIGFYRNNAYVAEHLREADVRSTRYMAGVVAVIELGMLLRYVWRWVLPGKCETVADFFTYTQSYWILLTAALLMLIYSEVYVRGKIRRFPRLSWLWTGCFFLVAIYFGIMTGLTDFSKGKMITAFLTMMLFVTVTLVWRPFTSILLMLGFGGAFLFLIDHYSVDRDGNPIRMGEGDRLNYITFLISMTVLVLTVYYQRYREAVKSDILAKKTITDERTGIPNMHRFCEESKAFQEAHADREQVFLSFNVENFRTYNDRYGYSGGNELLKKIGELLAEHFPEEPYARQGDDKFAALCDAEGHEERIRALREAFLAQNTGEIYLDLKTGVYRSSKVEPEPRLAVDHARYAASLLKNHNDRYIREYDQKLAEGYSIRQYVLNNIEKAVKEGYIQVYYQPVMWASDGELCGCEALARWIDPEEGFLSPGQFIPVLEECRQIHKLDRCIYETVCRRLRESMDAGEAVFPVSLNFSRLDFELMDAVGELEALVEKYRIPRHYLHVEITESALSENDALLHEALDAFHEKGYAVWLDDFGSGYSSMNVLKDYRFDLLKIDMVFLKNFGDNPNSERIIKSILELAASLDMKTLTEGVETKEAVEFLKKAGCGRLQGYFYGKPQKYEEIRDRIESGEYKLSGQLI
ncbi:MAG: EAL domain-containing protein [Lachnospiraceae bacterium]|nr:EAL domain-containing protein [Lachnospiraceae bacterium]